MALAEIFEHSWTRPDRRPIYEWAEENVILPAGAYSIPGRFSVKNTRYLIAPFDALSNDLVRVVTMRAPVRSGKSLLADIWVPWVICNDPGPLMWNMNTDALATRHGRSRLLPLLRAIPAVRKFLPLDVRKQDMLEMYLRNGMPIYLQGPAISHVQGFGARYVIEDELWMRAEGLHQEAVARQGDFEKFDSSKLLNIGQAGEVGDDMDLEYDAGDQGEWEAACMGCGRHMVPEMSGFRADGSRWGMRWDDNEKTRDKKGNWIIRQVLPTVRLECEHCGFVHLDEPRTHFNWNLSGQYRSRNSEALATHKSFWVHGIFTRSWDKLTHEFCAALNAFNGGNIDPLRIFTIKREARPFSEDKLYDRGPKKVYELTSEWKDEKARGMTVDCQEGGLFFVLVCALSEGEFRRLWFGALYSEAELLAKAEEWKIPSNRVLIDSGFDTKHVYAMCARNGWIALKGTDDLHFIHRVKFKGKIYNVPRSYSEPSYPDPESGRSTQGRKFCRLIRWSNPTIKDRLKRIRESGRWVEPANADPEDTNEKAYRKQMRGAWKKAKRMPNGRIVKIWVDNGDDHAYDAAAMMVLLATLLKLMTDISTDPDAPRGEVGASERESVALTAGPMANGDVC